MELPSRDYLSKWYCQAMGGLATNHSQPVNLWHVTTNRLPGLLYEKRRGPHMEGHSHHTSSVIISMDTWGAALSLG